MPEITETWAPKHVTLAFDGLLHCPLCEWTHELPRAQFAPGVAAMFGMSAAALADIHVHQDARRMETATEQHCKTHSVAEWVTALMRARDAAESRRLDLAAIGELAVADRPYDWRLDQIATIVREVDR